MGSAQAVHVVVEVQQLQAIELLGDMFDDIQLAGLHDLDTFSIPGLVLVSNLYIGFRDQ